MTSGRHLAGAALTAALVGFAAGGWTLGERGGGSNQAAVASEPAPGASDEPAQGEPLPPSPLPGADRPRVPAGILARAADARALERAPVCPPPAASEKPRRCLPEQRDSIEIEWRATREP